MFLNNTGINFNTAVENELKDDRSLIEKSYSKYLKSTEPGDYNASTGAYIAKDGSSLGNSLKGCRTVLYGSEKLFK